MLDVDCNALNRTLDAIEDARKAGLHIFVWGNMPYQDATKTRSILSSWELIAQAVEESQGCLAMEWPDTCESWNLPVIKRHLQRHRYESTLVKSCRFGAIGMDGCVRSGTWKVATNWRSLLHSLSHASTCTHSEHTTCAKCLYPAYFAVVVHQVVRSWVRSSLLACTACITEQVRTTSPLTQQGQMRMIPGRVEIVVCYLGHHPVGDHRLQKHSQLLYIQFNHLQVGNQMSLHTDGRNCGRSFTMSFGTFEGGKLMLHDVSWMG
eukprot:2561454-Amphidinium_carterae.2